MRCPASGRQKKSAAITTAAMMPTIAVGHAQPQAIQQIEGVVEPGGLLSPDSSRWRAAPRTFTKRVRRPWMVTVWRLAVKRQEDGLGQEVREDRRVV